MTVHDLPILIPVFATAYLFVVYIALLLINQLNSKKST